MEHMIDLPVLESGWMSTVTDTGEMADATNRAVFGGAVCITKSIIARQGVEQLTVYLVKWATIFIITRQTAKFEMSE